MEKMTEMRRGFAIALSSARILFTMSAMISRRITPFALVCLITAITLAQTSAPSSAPARSVWDGVYSKDQAERGRKAYDSLCARCHGEKLGGNDDAPALADEPFLKSWEGKSV